MTKQKVLTLEEQEIIRTKDFFDCIFPGVIKFMSDYYICGNSYKCVWVVKGYPPSTDAQALLSQLSDKAGVTLRLFHRLVEPLEQKKIMQDAARKNTMQSTSTDVSETVQANENMQDVVMVISNLRKNREPLLHTSVFIELKGSSLENLKELQSELNMELQRAHLEVDKLLLRQKEGFLSVIPIGFNMFGEQFERVLSASSVANLFPFNFSGKTDPHEFYESSAQKGILDTIPETPGLGVWHDGHVGIYIGNGYVIHANGVNRGVEMQKLEETKFTNWFEIPWIQYIDETISVETKEVSEQLESDSLEG